MKSSLYFGKVQHRRHKPGEHAFSFSLFMLYLDLDELPDLFSRYWFWSVEKWNLASFFSKDYLGGGKIDIRTAVENQVEKVTGMRPRGPIRMLTHLRYFGYCFNPVTFYYCFDPSDSDVEFVVAQITNTPWKERHCYVLDNRQGGLQEKNPCFMDTRFNKAFHVSPFMPMDIQYRWRFSVPGHKLSVFMQNFRNDQCFFDAALSLESAPVNSSGLARALTRFPLMTMQVTAAIYWHAARLWFKRMPFYDNPSSMKKRSKTDANN